MSNEKHQQFIDKVWNHYNLECRDFSWRNTTDPYEILISEVMLQQTQTHRVEPKYQQFLSIFPTVQHLAKAQLSDVIKQWQGLGYNRRAKFLHQTGKIIVTEYDSTVPNNMDKLITLPGIGPNTAGAIIAYAFNKPVIFIETNIRTVFINEFFRDREDVHDREIVSILEEVIDTARVRDWYYALTDYGVYLKSQLVNPSRKSKHHSKQSKFEGSKRQIRGIVIRKLSQNKMIYDELATLVKDNRLDEVLNDLLAESMIKENNSTYSIA